MLMEKIYRGEFDIRLFKSGGVGADENKVARILDTYRDLLKGYSPEALEAEGRIPADLLQGMGDAGLFGLSIETMYGGQGLNVREYLKVVGEIVKIDISIAMAFLAHLSIGIKAVQLFGNEFQREKYLSAAASGRMIFAYALTEPKTGSDAQHIETTALRSEDGGYYLLNGHKAYITNANYAGGMTVFAQMDPRRPGFMGAFIVETGWEGVKVGKDMPKMGLAVSSTAAIQFSNVRIPAENLIGRPGDGFKIAMSVLNYGRLGLGAASASVMQASVRDMLQRASSRIQFQVPIKEFQLIREKISRAYVNAAVSAAMNDFVAGLLEKDPLIGAAIETSHCKLFGTTRAWDAVYDALQVAGGAGYLKTLPYEKRMRDFRVATVFEGTTEIHSIYPALYGMRQTGKWLNGLSRQALAVELVKALVKREKWPLAYTRPVMKTALKEARKGARAARILLFSGMLAYGKSIAGGQTANREYLLRRITTLSVYSFGLLALLRKAEQKETSGLLGDSDLHTLEYFTAEATEARRQNSRFFDSRKERLSSTVFRDFAREGPG